MALEPWRKGKVIRIEDATSNTRRFWVEVPELEKFSFKAGQFITIDLPIHEKRNKRWRSYSIASWPDDSNVFELLIVLDPKGLGTPYLFNNITVGAELLFRGPQGVFTLEEPLDKDIVFICTGTGIAPFRSMLHDIINNNIAKKNLYLIFGCRTKGDLLYHDEMISLEKQIPNFKYIPTLSRELWAGRTGYVHPIYEEICRDQKEASFYICGWKNMLDEAKERLSALGFQAKDIHFELYG